MSKDDPIERLLALLGGDRELLAQLREAGFLPPDDTEIAPEHTEVARVTYTLIHELDVNWPGVEVALHLRSRLVAVETQLAELIVLMKKRSREPSQ
jgi:hypothetical protein